MEHWLLVVVILPLSGAVPSWPYGKSWGYATSGALGFVKDFGDVSRAAHVARDIEGVMSVRNNLQVK